MMIFFWILCCETCIIYRVVNMQVDVLNKLDGERRVTFVKPSLGDDYTLMEKCQ